ncbi:MAG: hypothetical protein V4659_12720 [Pseudomonadota bacterium]
MIQLPFAFALAAAAPPPLPPPADGPRARYDRCIQLATGDPTAGLSEASAWQLAGGGFLARQCLGIAYANLAQWESAASAFQDAARDAEKAKDPRAANYWAQAGNAWLAAGDAAKARAALDAALADPALTGLLRGEAELDRARALVASSDPVGARVAIDRALLLAGDDPLAWLLSATLARQAKDVARAKADIGQALRRSADDAAVQLEAGNIAALAGDEAGAKAAWAAVVRLRPDSRDAKAAEAALAQFD